MRSLRQLKKLRLLVVAAVLAAFSFVGVQFAQDTQPASAVSPSVEAEAAHFAITNPHLANQIRRSDPAVVEAEAVAAFSILNPDAANRERRKDPAEVEKDNWAAFAILSAKEIESVRLTDPEMRRRQEEVLRKLVVDP